MSDPAAAPDPRPPTGPLAYDAVGEVRFGVVLYGGVSLAIYINGVVQELLHLVRATAPDPDNGTRLLHDELAPVEAVYREIGRRLHGDKVGDDTGSVRTRFVVDLIAGTSAGGINGVYLAKALARQQSIAELTDLWVDDAAIELLVNDSVSEKKIGLKNERPPQSLLSGKRMLHVLHAALEGMDGADRRPDDFRSPYAEAIDL
jgi:patatin-related protein